MKFKQKGAESAFLLNMTVRTQECRVLLSEYGDGTPDSKSVGNSLFADNCLCRDVRGGESGAVARILFRPVSHLRELPYSMSDET